MKFFHLSDLHFGRQLQGYDLLEEQKEFTGQIKELVKQEKPDAIVVAGDIYDRSVPSAAAMTLLEDFFLAVGETSGEEKTPELLLIAGNHDNAERLRYGSAFLKKHHIHIAVLPPQEEGEQIQKITLPDAWGEVSFYLLPFTKPGMIRHLSGAEKVQSAQDAVRFLLEREQIDQTERNVFVSHQFYWKRGKETVRCGSELPDLMAGGLEGIDTAIVGQFDYVALGHIHSPQDLEASHIRYCGTPYPYSVSEAGQQKSITVVELREKGNVVCREIPCRYKRTVRDLKGEIEQLKGEAGADGCDDYVRLTLTDDSLPEQPKEVLERYYRHILEIRVDNRRSQALLEEPSEGLQELSPLEAFRQFFCETVGRGMDEEEERLLCDILKEVEE